MAETFDDCLLELGNPGRFRLLLYGLLLFNMCIVAPNFFLTLYAGYVPKHHCKLPPNSTFLINESIPLVKVHGHLELDMCHLWVDPRNKTLGTTKCLYGWEYELEDGEWFVSTEFDLVCKNSYILNLGISIQYTGIMLGGILFGILSDNIGRRKACIIAILGQSFFSILMCFAHSATAYFSFAFLSGVFIQGIHSCSYTMSTELFHPRQRTVQGIIIGLPWSLSIPIVAAIFWAIRNWSNVQMCIGLFSLLGVVYIWFIPESLRWHIARGNVDQAWEIAQRFARFNKMKLRPSLRDDFASISAKMVTAEKSSSIKLLKELFLSKRLRNYALIMGIIYFTGSALYLALGFSIPKLGGNKYTSYMISGSLDILSRCFPIFIYQRYGRRRPFSIFITLCSVFGFTSALLRYVMIDDGSTNYLPVCLAIMGSSCLTMSFGAMGLYITELFPTLLRSAGLGFCVTVGRIGSMLSPQVLLLDVVWELLPFVILCGLGVTCGMLIFLLPETNNKALPDSVDDADKLDRKNVN